MARGATEFDDLAGWMGHKPRGGGGGGGKFLSRWKEKGSVETWLHTKRLPLAIWRHPFPMYVITEDKDTKVKTKHVFGKKFTCHEDESVLQHPWRDKNTGEREHPPQRCGLCKFEEWAWQECQAWVDSHTWDEDAKVWKENKKGKGEGTDPCTKLFFFESEADEDKENVTLHLGGICNFFGQKDPPDGLLPAMKKAKIRGDMTWKQNAKVKCEYVLCVVDNDNIASGVQIAIETQALGEKIKEVITKEWKSNEINIQKTPYCIRWEYHEKEQFSKKYDAMAIMKNKPNERVLKLIRGEAPDLETLKECFNQQSMRSTLEQHCLVDSVPWDDLFPSAEQEKKWNKQDAEEEDDDDAEEEDDDDEEEEKPSKSKSKSKSDDDEEDEDGDKMVKCDECQKPMKLSASKCPHCGHAYEVSTDDDEEEEEEEEKPKLKSRSELAKEKASAEKKSTVKSTKKKSKDDDDDGDQDSEIPF